LRLVAEHQAQRLDRKLVNDMPTFETIDPKIAKRCRYDQHRNQKTTLTIDGSSVTAFVRSVMEVRSSPKRWIITLVVKPRIAA
jgi:hypothetical protein